MNRFLYATPLGAIGLELTDVITNTLIRAMQSVQKEFPGTISVAADTECDLRQFAMREPYNSKEFLLFLLSSGQQLPKELLMATLPEHLRVPVEKLLEQRSEFQCRKEELVRTGSYEQAAICRDIQLKLFAKIKNELACQNLTITLCRVRDALERLKWPVKMDNREHKL